MKPAITLTAMLALLGGCTTVAPDDGGMAARPADGPCDASGVQGMVGQTASAEIGARLLAETGATTLRWGPPRSAMTMDFRPDRLTVSYDDAMMIDRITCG